MRMLVLRGCTVHINSEGEVEEPSARKGSGEKCEETIAQAKCCETWMTWNDSYKMPHTS